MCPHTPLIMSTFTCQICTDEDIATEKQCKIHCATICVQCARKYFEQKVNQGDQNISCPCCSGPDLSVDTKETQQYVQSLIDTLEPHLDAEHHARLKVLIKQRSETFDPNFRRCPKCLNGFVGKPQNRCTQCQHCHSKYCVDCKADWMDQHANLLCSKFAQWKLDNNETKSVQLMTSMRRSLDHVWFECGRCKSSMIIEPPIGCLHINCRCSHESCMGCNQPYNRQRVSACDRFSRVPCTYRGLHCHHPRYCAYYLRDCTVDELTRLLLDAGVRPQPSARPTGACSVPVIDANDDSRACGQRVVYQAYQCCVAHSHLYLAQLIRQHRIDPLPILSAQFCMQELRRRGLPLPEREAYDDDPKYQVKCAQALRAYPLYD